MSKQLAINTGETTETTPTVAELLPRHALAVKTVASAAIASRLNAAQKDAAKLSLSAKNLAVVSIRIGVSGAGLKTLSTFYDELAHASIVISRDINRQAGQIAALTVSLWRKHLFCQKLLQVQATIQPTSDVLLDQQLVSGHQDLSALANAAQQQAQRLTLSIDELELQMRAMHVIVVNARMEAASLPDYKSQLTELMAQIHRSTTNIMDEVHQCKHWIKDLA